MTIYETQRIVDAPPEQVWQVLADVERWPEWRLTFRGPMAWLVRWFYGKLCQDYLKQEVNALQQTVERVRH